MDNKTSSTAAARTSRDNPQKALVQYLAHSRATRNYVVIISTVPTLSQVMPFGTA